MKTPQVKPSWETGTYIGNGTVAAEPKTIMKDDIFWVATCTDVFGGYGLFASGRTEAEAKEAIWELYKERSEAWNEEGQYLKTIDDLEEWWGVHYRQCKLGQAYFSDHDELTVFKPTTHKTK